MERDGASGRPTATFPSPDWAFGVWVVVVVALLVKDEEAAEASE